jgi:hypothetical protein
MMLADPGRHRRLIACTLIFIVLFTFRSERRGWFEREDPETAVATATSGRATVVPEKSASLPEAPADGTSEGPEGPTSSSLDRAHVAAANFTHEYLTWSPDESHADWVARLAGHCTPELAADIADARRLGAADAADRGDGWSQAAEIRGTQTLTVRTRGVEIMVLAEVTTDGSDATVTPTNLTVALREEDGAWLVDDLR